MQKIIDAEKEQAVYIMRTGQCRECGTIVSTKLSKYSAYEKNCKTACIFCPICTNIVLLKRE